MGASCAGACYENNSDKSLTGSGAGGGGGAAGRGGSKGEFLRLITCSSVLTAFSIIGSTYFSIPNLLSKSYTAGIIFVRLYIFENTLTKG